jgi:type IV pilus assembly protein PilN
MIRINLLPVKAAQKKEMLKGQLMVLVLALIVTGAICGAAYMYVVGEVEAKQAKIDQKRTEISRLQKAIQEVKDFEKRQKALRAKLNVLEKLKTARTGPVYLLDDLYEAMPEKLWITKFSEGKGQAKIDGIGGSEEIVAQFLRDLENADSFGGVELKTIKQVTKDKIKFHQFQLTCKTVSRKPDAKK